MHTIQIQEHTYSAEQIGYHIDDLIEIAVFKLVSTYGWGLIYKYTDMPSSIYSRPFNNFRSMAETLRKLGYGAMAGVCSENVREGTFFVELRIPTLELEPELINKVVIV